MKGNHKPGVTPRLIPRKAREMLHNLKINQKWLYRILIGEKTFEVRLNDRDYQVGDHIHFMPLEDEIIDVYKLRSPLPDYRITYIHHGFGMAENYVVLGIEESK